MARWTSIQMFSDTSLFDSMQLHTRTVLTAFMRCWAKWTHEHLIPFPRMLRELNFGVVVARASIRYERPFSLFTADQFEIRGALQVMQRRHVLVGDVRFMNGEERFVRSEIVLRPVAMSDGGSLAALPTQVNGPIIQMFKSDEVSDKVPSRPVRKALGELGSATPVAEVVRPIRVHRHDSEAADQWSYIEIGAQAATAREAMVLEANGESRSLLQPGLSTPTRAIDLEITRPLFLFDQAHIRTRAYHRPSGLTFVHVYQSELGGRHDHATVVEHFDA